MLIDDHRMALAECAAAAILAAQPHRGAFEQERTERQILGECPVGRATSLHGLDPSGKDPGQLGVDGKAFRGLGGGGGDQRSTSKGTPVWTVSNE